MDEVRNNRLTDIKPLLLNEINSSEKLKISQDTLKIRARDTFLSTYSAVEDKEIENMLARLSSDDVFLKVDLNGDGFLSYEEIVKLGRVTGDKEQITLEDLEKVAFTKEHIDFILNNPQSKRAAEIAACPDFKLNYTDGSRLDYPSYLLVELARRNPSAEFAHNLIKRSDYSPTKEDIDIARKNPDSQFAIGLAESESRDLMLFHSRELKDIAWANPNSKFAKALPSNGCYFVSEKDQEIARANPNSLFTESLLRDNRYMVTGKDHETARENPDSLFAQRIDTQPSFEVTKEDKNFIRENPDCQYAIIVGHLTYDLEHKDFVVASKNPISMFSRNLGQHHEYNEVCKRLFGFVPKEYPPNVR